MVYLKGITKGDRLTMALLHRIAEARYRIITNLGLGGSSEINPSALMEVLGRPWKL